MCTRLRKARMHSGGGIAIDVATGESIDGHSIDLARYIVTKEAAGCRLGVASKHRSPTQFVNKAAKSKRKAQKVARRKNRGDK